MKNIVLPIFAILLAGGIVYKYMTADPAGYCRAQQRYISDEEFSQASLALYDWESKQNKKYFDRDPQLFERQLEAHDRMKQNSKHGGFVNVDRSDTHTSFRWMFGYQQIYVELNANSGDEQTGIYFDRCGEFIASRLGNSYPGNKKLTTTNYLEILNKK